MLALVAVVVIAVSHLVAVATAVAQPRSTHLRSTVRTPAHSTPRHTPAHSTPRHTPAHSTPRHTSAHSTPRHTSAHSTPRHTPAHSAPGHTPAHSTPQHNPAHSTPRQTPARGTRRHSPALSTPLHTPDPEGQRNAPLGCALCLAVADWLNTSLAEAHACKKRSKRRLSAAELSIALADACNTGFEGYQLWPPPVEEDADNEMAGSTGLVRHYSHSSPPSNWMERLRNECRWYVQEADELDLYRQWRGMLSFPPQRLDLFLCKNSGWLRPCVNLLEEELPRLHPPVVEEEPPVAVIVAKEATKMAAYSITRFRIICTRLICWHF